MRYIGETVEAGRTEAMRCMGGKSGAGSTNAVQLGRLLFKMETAETLERSPSLLHNTRRYRQDVHAVPTHGTLTSLNAQHFDVIDSSHDTSTSTTLPELEHGDRRYRRQEQHVELSPTSPERREIYSSPSTLDARQRRTNTGPTAEPMSVLTMTITTTTLLVLTTVLVYYSGSMISVMTPQF
jgi:hypothetical protein